MHAPSSAPILSAQHDEIALTKKQAGQNYHSLQSLKFVHKLSSKSRKNPEQIKTNLALTSKAKTAEKHVREPCSPQASDNDLRMGPKWVQNGSKMGPKWVQNGSNMGPKWVQNGSNMGPKWVQNGSKNGSKMGQNGSKMGPKWVQNGSKMGPKMGPKWVQN